MSGIISDVLSALAHLHARHIVHCDIKPDNILYKHPAGPLPPIKAYIYGGITDMYGGIPDIYGGNAHIYGGSADMFGGKADDSPVCLTDFGLAQVRPLSVPRHVLVLKRASFVYQRYKGASTVLRLLFVPVVRER